MGVEYVCSSCGKTILVNSREDVHCPNCKCMILYKKRRPEYLFYKAR